MLAACAAAMLVSACAGERIAATTASASNGEVHGGYILATGDSLRVNVFDEASLTGDYEIGLDGNLSLPLIEMIPATGRTADAVAAIIADRLQRGGYVLTPKVSVEVTKHRPFYILGEVKTPGKYPYDGSMTLSQAVAMAGGYTPRANKRSIILQRQDWPESRRIRLDGSTLRITPGDTITIQESFF